MIIDNSPALAGVVGWPIAHSKSPLIHGHWLKQHQISGYYIPIGLRPENFETAIRSMPKLGFKGVNVTIPYKETILPLATTISDRAALIGAANTIVFRSNGGIHADNTDGYGFIQNIRQFAPDWRGNTGPALVLGAGGASRAVLSALLDEGVPEVRLTNRTRHRAEILKDQFGARVTIVDWAKKNDACDGIATLVNTTALGMEGQPPLTIRLDAAPQSCLVTDIVYTPLKTELILQAESHGMRCVDGLGMLLHQAVPGFESWFDIRPTVDSALREQILSA